MARPAPLLDATNRLMQTVGMGGRSFVSVDELRENASSLLVALFEATFKTRLADVERKPTTRAHYAFNAQRVIDSLKAVLPAHVSIPDSVTGDAVSSGSVAEITYLVGLFTDVARVLVKAGQQSTASSSGNTGDAATMAKLRASLKGVQSPGKARPQAAAPPQPPSAARSSPQRVAPPPVPGAGATMAASTRSAGSPSAAGRGSSNVAAKMDEAEAKRAAMAAASIKRQQQSVLKRMLTKNQEELGVMQTMIDQSIKARQADTRVAEAAAIRSATIRAQAAKYERKVVAIRTRRVLENMTRTTLAMRIARSSRQAAAAASLLKAVAAQQRLAAAERIRIAAEERAAELLTGQAKMAWAEHAARAMQEALAEETAKQVAQRQAAMKSQKEALLVAMRDLRVDEAALLAEMEAEQRHAETAFLAHNVEPVAVGDNAGPYDPEATAAAFLSSAVDTDGSTMHVDTMNRATKHLGRLEGARADRMGHTQGMLRRIGQDTGALLGQAEAMVQEAQGQVQASQATLRRLSKA